MRPARSLHWLLIAAFVMMAATGIAGVTKKRHVHEKTLFQEKAVVKREKFSDSIREKDLILDEIRQNLHETGQIDPVLVGKLVNIEKLPKDLSEDDEAEVRPDMRGALKNLNEDDIVESLRSQSEGGAAFAQQHPRILRFIVRLARDEQALDQIFSITTNRKKLILFSGIFFFIMIMGWLMRGPSYGEASVLQRLFRRFGVFVFTICAEGLLFALFFYKELTPAWTIFRQTFF